MILPEHDSRINLEKLRQIKLDELQLEKIKQMAQQLKERDEENMKDDEYYRTLFKEMLRDINQSKMSFI